MKLFAMFSLISLFLLTNTATAGSYTGTWPNIATSKPVDALACATQALTVQTEDHKCLPAATWNKNSTNVYAAECRFVMALSVVKTVWHLEGSYDDKQNFTGQIWQTLPTCTGFLCSYIGSVYWYGRSPTPPQVYDYQWNDGYGAECAVDRLPGNGQIAGDFYGSY